MRDFQTAVSIILGIAGIVVYLILPWWRETGQPWWERRIAPFWQKLRD